MGYTIFIKIFKPIDIGKGSFEVNSWPRKKNVDEIKIDNYCINEVKDLFLLF